MPDHHFELFWTSLYPFPPVNLLFYTRFGVDGDRSFPVGGSAELGTLLEAGPAGLAVAAQQRIRGRPGPRPHPGSGMRPALDPTAAGAVSRSGSRNPLPTGAVLARPRWAGDPFNR